MFNYFKRVTFTAENTQNLIKSFISIKKRINIETVIINLCIDLLSYLLNK